MENAPKDIQDNFYMTHKPVKMNIHSTEEENQKTVVTQPK